MQDAAFDLHGPEQQWPAAVTVSLVRGHPHIVPGVVDPLGHRRARLLASGATAPALCVSQSVTVRGLDPEGAGSASDCRDKLGGVIAGESRPSGGRWRRLDVVTLLKALYSDRMMTAPGVVLSLEGIVLEYLLEEGGRVRSSVASFVDAGESWRHGAAGSRQWTRFDVLVQDGGAVRRRGGVDGGPDKVITSDQS